MSYNINTQRSKMTQDFFDFFDVYEPSRRCSSTSVDPQRGIEV